LRNLAECEKVSLMNSANELRGMVGRLNNGIFSLDGSEIGKATATAIYKILAKGPKIVGYKYSVDVNGKAYIGKAKGPGEFITLRAA
jgi:hypothetical protein